MRSVKLVALGLLTVTPSLWACAPTAPPLGTADQARTAAELAPAASDGGRTVTIAVRYEVGDLAAKTLTVGPSTATKRSFNASLALIDAAGQARPYLSEVLPTLDTDSWRVLSDGRMETTYRLRPNLTWHDGTRLTAEDFIFALRVYTAPGLGAFSAKPQDRIEEITASDGRTLLIRWSGLYPGGGALATGDLDPLPRHLMEGSFATFVQDPTTKDAFLGATVWNTQYIGLGPYRLTGWEPGSAVEGAAFDGHALGRPKIDRLIIRIVPDENTGLTNMLAGAVDLALNFAVRIEEGSVLRRQWESTKGGTVLYQPGTRHLIWLQWRPEFLKTPALMDLRVRQALAHGIDRQAVSDAVFDGRVLTTESFVPRQVSYYNDVDQAITKHPYDLRRVQQLMVEAGFTKDAGGFFTRSGGERFHPELMSDSGLYEREATLLQETWRRSGLDIETRVLPSVQVRNNEARASFPEMYASSTSSSETALNIFTRSEIGTVSNRWAGGNRGGWSSPELERWWEAFNSDLPRDQRNRDVLEMMKVLSMELPYIGLGFVPEVWAHLARLQGPEVGTPDSLTMWNMHEWAVR